MEHTNKEIRLSLMKKIFQDRNNIQKPPTSRYLIYFVLITVLLSGCNFPTATRMEPTLSSQQQTEISGILNLPDLTSTAAPTKTPPSITLTVQSTQEEALIDGHIRYQTQQGDTLSAVALRFDVPVDSIQSSMPLTEDGLLPIGTRLQIPDILEDHLPYNTIILPDSEVIYGPSVGDFNTLAYVEEAGGFLATYEEKVKEETLSGAEIVNWVAIETSTNPRLLLAFLEYQSGWLFGFPPDAARDPYPIGFGATLDTGLYKELMITARVLAQGFYGWRDGSRVTFSFYGGRSARLAPELNAGSAAIMALFGSIYLPEAWEDHMYGEDSFLTFYREMFGDEVARAAAVEPYLTNTIQQPELMLPFAPMEAWSFTGGPHMTWQTGTPRGAVDYAPITGEPACAVSAWWTTAAAPGLVTRSDRNVVAIDLDGDGDEGTGWVLVYMHIADKDRVPVGTWLERDDKVGHPSCEGGNSTGTHVHFTRKYNGEWVGVGKPLPMVLSGWQIFAGERRYEGFMQKGEQIVTAVPYGSSETKIIRDE
jgi:murein DD-endopeptidase MepM/ murein hydrolase activator NlpD